MTRLLAATLTLAATLGSSSCAPSQEDLRTAVQQVLEQDGGITRMTGGKTIGPYSPAVTAGRFVFLSGQIGLDPETGKMSGTDVASQTIQALENISSILREAGLDSSAVIQCTVFLTDMSTYQTMNSHYGEYFNGKFPARTTVEVSRLPAGALIEIAAIAYRD